MEAAVITAVGIDVSKSKSTVAVRRPGGEIVLRPFEMSEDEIAIMDGGRCILQLRGVRPFFSEKFDITKHPHYKYLADADKKNTFDVDRFLSTLRRKRQQVVAQDESFDLYEIDLSDENAAE